LGPFDPNRKFALTQLAHIARRRGDYESAIDLSIRSHAVNQGLTATYWNLISCNALLGRMPAARRFLSMYETVTPGMTIARVKSAQSIGDPKFLAPLLEGLWLAGMPEQ
ncbi:MAG: tetratricopeptide repeat protein, partial [Planctomycetota bacterium]